MCADVPKVVKQGDRETLQVKLPFALDTYRVYFPGTYILDHLGNLKCARGLGHLPSACHGKKLQVKCKFQCKESTGTIEDILEVQSMYSIVDCLWYLLRSFLVIRKVMLQSRATEFPKAARTSLPVSADPNTFCSQRVLVGVLRVQLNAKSCQVMPSHAKLC